MKKLVGRTAKTSPLFLEVKHAQPRRRHGYSRAALHANATCYCNGTWLATERAGMGARVSFLPSWTVNQNLDNFSIKPESRDQMVGWERLILKIYFANTTEMYLHPLRSAVSVFFLFLFFLQSKTVLSLQPCHLKKRYCQGKCFRIHFAIYSASHVTGLSFSFSLPPATFPLLFFPAHDKILGQASEWMSQQFLCQIIIRGRGSPNAAVVETR